MESGRSISNATAARMFCLQNWSVAEHHSLSDRAKRWFSDLNVVYIVSEGTCDVARNYGPRGVAEEWKGRIERLEI